MKPRSAIAVCICLIAFANSPRARAQVNSPRTRVTVQEVSEAITSELRSRLPKLPPPPVWDVDIPLAVPVARTHKLRVASVCREPDSGLLRFQLACAEPGACLPFLAYARIAEPAPVVSCSFRRTTPTTSPTSVPVVQPGERITAVLVGRGLKMTAAVMCMDRGAPGEVVRVRGGQGLIFRARVARPGWVEALVE